jgi:hypothetical protein
LGTHENHIGNYNNSNKLGGINTPLKLNITFQISIAYNCVLQKENVPFEIGMKLDLPCIDFGHYLVLLTWIPQR